MALVKQALRDKIRAQAGNPPTDDVADWLIDSYIDSALVRINEVVPAWKPFYITTAVDIQEYLVDVAVINVLMVDWRGDTYYSDEFGADFSAFDALIVGGGLYDVETGLYKQVRDALLRKQVEDHYSWDFREHDRKLFLIPPPQTANKKVWYIGTIVWTLDTVPVRFGEYIEWYGISETMSASARKKRRMSAIANTGQPFPWAVADPQLQDAATLMKRFTDAMIFESRKAVF